MTEDFMKINDIETPRLLLRGFTKEDALWAYSIWNDPEMGQYLPDEAKEEIDEEYLKMYALKYEDNIPKDIPYFKKMFSRGFLNWVKTGKNNNSTGNGALMRLSPVAYLFNDYIKLNENIFLLTNCSHHSSEALSSAYLMGQIIYYARKSMTKDEIVDTLSEELLESDNTLSYKALIELREEKGMTIEDKDLKAQYENYVFNTTNKK